MDTAGGQPQQGGER